MEAVGALQAAATMAIVVMEAVTPPSPQSPSPPSSSPYPPPRAQTAILYDNQSVLEHASQSVPLAVLQVRWRERYQKQPSRHPTRSPSSSTPGAPNRRHPRSLRKIQSLDVERHEMQGSDENSEHPLGNSSLLSHEFWHVFAPLVPRAPFRRAPSLPSRPCHTTRSLPRCPRICISMPAPTPRHRNTAARSPARPRVCCAYARARAACDPLHCHPLALSQSNYNGTLHVKT